MPKPLSVSEVEEAAEKFFPLYEVVNKNMPKGSTTEDTLKVMETVCKLAQKLRLEKEDERFGFVKASDED